MGGLIPLDNLDLAAWQQNNRISLEVWEVRQIRSLSREYCSSLAKFSDPNEPPPYTAHKVMTPEKQDQIAAAFRSFTTRKG